MLLKFRSCCYPIWLVSDLHTLKSCSQSQLQLSHICHIYKLQDPMASFVRFTTHFMLGAINRQRSHQLVAFAFAITLFMACVCVRVGGVGGMWAWLFVTGRTWLKLWHFICVASNNLTFCRLFLAFYLFLRSTLFEVGWDRGRDRGRARSRAGEFLDLQSIGQLTYLRSQTIRSAKLIMQ